MYPIPIEHLIRAFMKLPSVGRRTAERFVFYLLKSGKKDVAELTNSLQELIKNIRSCEECWDFSDTSPCAICANTRRERTVLCVVAEPQDIRALERTGAYKGMYHVLRGTIDTEEENLGKGLKIKELADRIAKNNSTEIILALNPDLRGETTMMFLEKKLIATFPTLTMTRLARGLPMGSDLQYADEITLSSALKYRTKN